MFACVVAEETSILGAFSASSYGRITTIQRLKPVPIPQPLRRKAEKAVRHFEPPALTLPLPPSFSLALMTFVKCDGLVETSIVCVVVFVPTGPSICYSIPCWRLSCSKFSLRASRSSFDFIFSGWWYKTVRHVSRRWGLLYSTRTYRLDTDSEN